VKLVDFGIAGSLSDPAGLESGMTPGYAAPERFCEAHGSPEQTFTVWGCRLRDVDRAIAVRGADSGPTGPWRIVNRFHVPVREREPNAHWIWRSSSKRP